MTDHRSKHVELADCCCSSLVQRWWDKGGRAPSRILHWSTMVLRCSWCSTYLVFLVQVATESGPHTSRWNPQTSIRRAGSFSTNFGSVAMKVPDRPQRQMFR